MAFLYRNASLTPPKVELMAGWLPGRPWYRGPATPKLRRVVSFRFDDPAGEVGVETTIIDPGDGRLLHVPLTYRGAPLDGAEPFLLGTAEHSALGRRWFYDGCGDPVYAATLTEAMFTGGGQAAEFVDAEGELVEREPSCTVRGSGGGGRPRVEPVLAVEDGEPTIVRTGNVELQIIRVLDDLASPDQAVHLTVTWPQRDAPLLLARARLV